MAASRLDRPLLAQFVRYLGQTVQLNLGRSIKTHQTVAELIGRNVAWFLGVSTVELNRDPPWRKSARARP